MPFERFKAKHGGMGPAQALYAGLTEGEGLFGQWRPSFVRDRIGATVDAIAGDDELPDEFKEQAEAVRTANLTVPEAFAAISGLQQRARDIKTVQTAYKGFGAQQAGLRKAAMSPEDRAQLDVLDSQAEYGTRLMLSSNPELRAMGRSVMEKALAGQQSFATTNEAQALAAETKYGEQNWSRFSGLYDDLYRESSAFLEIQRSHGVLKSAYTGRGEPGNANDLAAINSLQRMIDPGATVRDGDVSLLQNLAGVPELLVTAANRVAKKGGRFTPQERAELIALGDRIMSAANEKQAATNVRFQDQAIAGELEESLVRRLAMPLTDTGVGGQGLNYGTNVTGDAQPTGEETPEGVIRDTVVGLGDIYQGARRGVGNVFESILGGTAQPERRNTDEYAPTGDSFNGEPVQRGGTVRGVYVPPFLRRRQ